MLQHKRAATKVVKSLGLQADLRARAVVLVAADSSVGNSLRDLIQLNEDDPALKALVEEFFTGEGTGKAMLCTDNTQFGKVLTADVLPIVLATCSTCCLKVQPKSSLLIQILWTLSVLPQHQTIQRATT